MFILKRNEVEAKLAELLKKKFSSKRQAMEAAVQAGVEKLVEIAKSEEVKTIVAEVVKEAAKKKK